MGIVAKLAENVSPSLLLLGRIYGPLHRLVFVSKFANSCFALTLTVYGSQDRDGAKFNLSQEDTQKRRYLMWEIYTYDSGRA